jgi:23S rRNA pseudouridine2457 synthase
MNKYFAIYKPFQVLSQFSESDGKQTLKSIYDFPKDVYPIGRLDYDSEGLLLLTNDNKFKTKILSPKSNITKTYVVQVEGIPSPYQIEQLRIGVLIKLKQIQYRTKPANVEVIEEPIFPERIPPIRFRKNIPTTWLSITITEGKNRQIRKMTAAVNLPTLRLVRFAIGDLTLNHLKNSQIAFMSMESIYKLTLKS